MNRRHTHERGFALLVAVIFMAVMLSFSLALSSLSYKQTILAAYATESHYAFYAADAALECVLYYDQQKIDSSNNKPWFDYAAHSLANLPQLMSCANTPATRPASLPYDYNATRLSDTQRFSLDPDLNGNPTRCADVTIYKYASPQIINGASISTYIFSQGYDVPCTKVDTLDTRYASRGLQAHY